MFGLYTQEDEKKIYSCNIIPYLLTCTARWKIYD